MPRLEPRSHFIVSLCVAEDGALEIKQPAELFELEFADEGPVAIRGVWVGELADDEYGLSELVGEAEDDGSPLGV